jgi:hypothetical protein
MAFDPLSTVVDLGKTLIDKFIPDPKAKAEATQKLLEMQQNGDLQVIANQVGINKIEAASTNVFIAGWRPFIGWVCGGALAIQMVIGPLVVWFSEMFNHPVKLVVLDVSLLTTLLVGMLGLGGMRTVEKLQGVQDKH